MIRCPACGSGSVKRSAAVYDQGISRSTGRNSGVWFSGRGAGIWSGRSANERVSAVADINAPPAEFGAAAGFMLVFAATILLAAVSGSGFGTFMVSIPVGLALGAVAATIVAGRTRESRVAARERYERQWYCSKCGGFFEHDLHSDAPPEEPSFGPRSSEARSSATTRSEYAVRIRSPVQRARTATDRDLAGLANILSRSAPPDFEFDPLRPVPLDLGVVSRLASLGYLRHDAAVDRFLVTEEGVTIAKQGR